MTPTLPRAPRMNAHFVTRACCPVCGAASAPTLLSRPYAEPRLRVALERFYAEVGRIDTAALLGADYVLQGCARCGLVYQRDVPDDFLLGKLYEEWISPTRAFERFHAQITPVRQAEIARDVAISLALVRRPADARRTLDYGCGWGEWGRATIAAGAETWGTELSASRRAACERDGIKVVADEALPDGHFDLINADQVFEHLPAPAATLALLTPKLRAGGVIRIAVPNGWRIARALAAFDRELQRPRLGGLNPVAPLEHLNCFTTRTLVALAATCGLVRCRPPWRVLRESRCWPPGLRAKVKQLVLPAYLRSRWSTQLWFTASAGGA